MSSNDSSADEPIKIKCPRCKDETIYSTTNKFRPFCSERCKLIDLGAWATGKYAIPISSTLDSGAQVDVDSESEDGNPSSDDTSDDDFGPNHLQ